jgi:hypothetical protein
MKDALSLVTSVIIALCCAVFLTTMKPTVLSAVPAPNKPAHCRMVGFWCGGMP